MMSLDEVADRLEDIAEYTVPDRDGTPIVMLTEVFVHELAQRLRIGDHDGKIH